VERTTPSVAIYRSHTCPVGWIGTYRIYLPFRIASTQPCRSSILKGDSTFLESKGERAACHTDLSKSENQVVGNIGAWGCSEARERCAASHSSPIVRSETPRQLIRSFSASYCSRCFNMYRPGLLPLQRRPRLRISASHCVGSIRPELVVVLK
jgi:hypothetical protein